MQYISLQVKGPCIKDVRTGRGGGGQAKAGQIAEQGGGRGFERKWTSAAGEKKIVVVRAKKKKKRSSKVFGHFFDVFSASRKKRSQIDQKFQASCGFRKWGGRGGGFSKSGQMRNRGGGGPKLAIF